ncbi:AAA domain-containing protein [Streptococcus orisratti]|uniref:DEAD/DEAH box helicase n=1 Tax=Streptococcus orisratti TaxID=114652 RepID=UPI00047606F0|nr:AAA domain-containing protein [Streptococcus orisratti]
MMINNNKILDAWIKVEQLSEGNIDRKNGGYTNFEGNNYKKILREFLNRQKQKANSGIAIYCGIFPFQEIIEKLRIKYGLKATEEELTTSEKFTFALYFDKDLNFLADKLFLTMSGYIHQRQSLPDNFFKIENDFRERMNQAFSASDFNEVFMKLLEEYSISPKNCMYRFIEDLDDDTNLHSFFISDLEYAKSHATKNVKQYLSGFLSEVINLDSNSSSSNFHPSILKSILKPKNYPLGRFPSNPKYALSMMQQVAVNIASNDGENIRSVNGPPGTGKTTLLRDIFADLVTEQAKLICDLANPVLKGNLVYHDHPYLMADLPTEIANKGIVVASSNNGAVKNIVNELPQSKSIYQELDWLTELNNIDYFTEISNELHPEEKSEITCKKYWGLFSIEGGNSQNRYRLQQTLQAVKNELCSEKFQPNPSVYVEFQAQYQELIEKRQKMQRIADKFDLHSKLEKVFSIMKAEFENTNIQKCMEMSKIQSELTQLDDTKKRTESELLDYQNLVSVTDDRKQLAQQDFEIIKLHVPRFFWLKRFFAPSKLQSYFKTLDEASSNLKEISKKLNLEKRHCSKLEGEIRKYSFQMNHLYQAQEDYEKWKSDKEHEFRSYQTQISKLQSELSVYSNVKLDFSLSYEELQVSNFWFGEEYRKDQSQLFIKALAVRKQFLYDNKKHFEKALWIWEAPKTYLIRNNSNELFKAAWNWVNFAIPVISTTFASFSTMFQYLPENSIGNLFIDEAGQALPQASIGAIFRSRRVMAVGDPSQIQPVMTLDKNILGFLAQRYKVEERYLSSSTQSLMDSASKYGFKKQDGTWIGIPLWVHRRSSEPMFSISNKISYDNLMVQGKKKEEVQGKGKWFDISGVAKDKFVSEQAEFLKEELQKRREEFDDIYVITPFKNVASRLIKELDKIDFTQRENKKVINVGTVHTFQGKENKIVYFVLGADSRSKGAARWAVSEPSILNVAATRAKEEFYIIGDKALYKHLNSPIITDVIAILDDYKTTDFNN